MAWICQLQKSTDLVPAYPCCRIVPAYPFSSATWILPITSPSCLNMGRSSYYRSPSTNMRNQRRFVKFLKTKLSKILSLSNIHETNKLNLSTFKSSLDIPPSKPRLVKTDATFTNYPEPCKTCQQNQCQFNLQHYFSFSIINAIDEVMTEHNLKEPPDG